MKKYTISPMDRNDYAGFAGTRGEGFIVETPRDFPLRYPEEVTEELGDVYHLTIIIDEGGVSFNYMNEDLFVNTFHNTEHMEKMISEYSWTIQDVIEVGQKFCCNILPLIDTTDDLLALGFERIY